MKRKILVKSTKDQLISKTRFVHHVLRVTPWFKKNGKLGLITIVRNEVVMLPLGGQVLPYFKDTYGRWKIVSVKQYRPAIKKETFEGPGGRLDGEKPSVALSRELEEETGIKVSPASIRIVFEEYTHPSILSASVFGGIVEVKENMVENKRNAGKPSEKEQTEVEVFDLLDFLTQREKKSIKIDLLTSRLVDEVAKAVGLLEKRYTAF